MRFSWAVSGDSLSTVEFYDPESNEWQLAPAMAMLRSRLGVAVLRDKLYAFGGYNGKDRLATVEVYDAVREEWSTVAPMKCKRRYLDGYVVGFIAIVFVFKCLRCYVAERSNLRLRRLRRGDVVEFS